MVNLVICNVAISCPIAMTFYFLGALQRIYSLLQNNISNLTIKSLSWIRLESRTKTVKTIKFQAPKVRDDFFPSKTIDDLKIKSEAKCLAM